MRVTDLRKHDVLCWVGSSIYDWHDPFGKLFQQTSALVTEFAADLNHLRTPEGVDKACAKGRIEGKRPELTLVVRKTIHRRYHAPTTTRARADLAEECGVGRDHPPHHQRRCGRDTNAGPAPPRGANWERLVPACTRSYLAGQARFGISGRSGLEPPRAHLRGLTLHVWTSIRHTAWVTSIRGEALGGLATGNYDTVEEIGQ